MLRAWASVRAGAEVSDARAWLHRIVHNAAMDALADRRGEEIQLSEAVSDGVPTQERAIERFEVRRALAAVADLPRTQRRAFTLTAIEGRSGREAADALGVSEGALRMMVHRARRRLRATAAALFPVPLRGWLASLLESPPVCRLAEARGGAGFAAAAAQAVALAGITGATVTGASLLSNSPPRTPARPSPAALVHEAAGALGRTGVATVPSGRRVRLALSAGTAPDGARRVAGHRRPGGYSGFGSRRPDRAGVRRGGDSAPSQHNAPSEVRPGGVAESAPAARYAGAVGSGGTGAPTSSPTPQAAPTDGARPPAPQGAGV